MSKHIIGTLLFLLLGLSVLAQKDSLFISIKEGRAMSIHEVKKDENLYSIAQQYNVPALVLSQNNDVSFYETLVPNRKLFIPLGNYNYVKTKPADTKSAKTLYYRVLPSDNYTSMAAALSVPEDFLKSWNKDLGILQLPNNIMIAGWILYQSPDVPTSNEKPSNPNGSVATVGLTPAVVVKKDTVKGPPTELEKQYNYQTSNGQFLDSTNGMVVFFKPQTAIDNKLLYAFSNEFAKGRVVKVVNPSNGKFVYAKVIGSLPTTKQYINAKIGLDGRARAELETREIKLWCDFFLKY